MVRGSGIDNYSGLDRGGGENMTGLSDEISISSGGD
jgi:hypothetical protein